MSFHAISHPEFWPEIDAEAEIAVDVRPAMNVTGLSWGEDSRRKPTMTTEMPMARRRIRQAKRGEGEGYPTYPSFKRHPVKLFQLWPKGDYARFRSHVDGYGWRDYRIMRVYGRRGMTVTGFVLHHDDEPDQEFKSLRAVQDYLAELHGI